MRISNALLAMAAAALIMGCAQNRAPANKALDGTKRRLKDVRDDAAGHAPDGLKGRRVAAQGCVRATTRRNTATLRARPSSKAVGSLKDAVVRQGAGAQGRRCSPD
jgi:hypothetical protein